jgi:hypothetical protein
MTECLVPFKVRGMVKGDRPLILGTLLNSYYRGAVAPLKFISYQTFMVLYGPIVEKLLKTSEVRIASNPEDPDTVIAWAIVQSGILHFVWVKDSYRRNGVCRALLRDLGDKVVYSHETLVFRRHVAGAFPKWQYRPEVLK